MAKREDHIIIAIHITDRLTEVSEVQAVLTKFGAVIKTRLGLHQVSDGYDGADGIIILEVLDDKNKKDELVTALVGIDGVDMREVVFEH
jgi:hypothetical protein